MRWWPRRTEAQRREAEAAAHLHQRPARGWVAGLRVWAAGMGRRRHEPERRTEIYARYRQAGSWGRGNRASIKPTPANLRYFSRTPYAAKAIAAFTKPIANLDWQVKLREGATESAETKRQAALANECLASPNHDDTLTSLIQQIVEDLCVCGAGAIEHRQGGDPARPLWLWPVDALSIQVYADWDGDRRRPRYRQALGMGNIGVGQGIDLLNDELVYIRERPTTDSPFSVGKLEIAFNSINRLLGVADYAGNVAANAHPLNLILLKGAGQEELETFRAYWRNEIEGQGQQPAIGGEDVKVVALRGNTDDSLYLKYQVLVIREIAVAFGVSPQNLGVESDVNRNVAEVAEDRDWDLEIKPMARLIASTLTREVLWGGLGWSQIELVPGGLDREDEKASADIYKIEYEGNAVTGNEYRARTNRPPLKSPFAEMTFAEVQIAIAAARGAKQVNPKVIEEE